MLEKLDSIKKEKGVSGEIEKVVPRITSEPLELAVLSFPKTLYPRIRDALNGETTTMHAHSIQQQYPTPAAIKKIAENFYTDIKNI